MAPFVTGFFCLTQCFKIHAFCSMYQCFISLCRWMIVYSQCYTTIVHACCRFSRVQLFATLWTVAHQAPLSMVFSRQEYWRGLPCPPPGDLPNEHGSPVAPALQADYLPLSHRGSPCSSRQVYLKATLEVNQLLYLRVFENVLFRKFSSAFHSSYLNDRWNSIFFTELRI